MQAIDFTQFLSSPVFLSAKKWLKLFI